MAKSEQKPSVPVRGSVTDQLALAESRISGKMSVAVAQALQDSGLALVEEVKGEPSMDPGLCDRLSESLAHQLRSVSLGPESSVGPDRAA